MPSPFPGMNPYMEGRAEWAGIHLYLLANFGRQLAPQVRPRYRVHAERYMSLGEEFSKFRPDLKISAPPIAEKNMRGALATPSEATLIAENLALEEETEIPPYLEILSEEGEVVTIIEVLSPINKEGDYHKYLQKRYELLKSGVHVVEIDLLREGRRVPLSREVETPYLSVVSRAHEYPTAHLWGITWADPLPILPIPLRGGDADVSLALAPALAEAYETTFEGFIDYRQDPPGMLTNAWRAEIDALLRAQGLR